MRLLASSFSIFPPVTQRFCEDYDALFHEHARVTMLRHALNQTAIASARRAFASPAVATQLTKTRDASFISFDAHHSDEMPLRGVADKIGGAFGPLADAIAESQKNRATASAKPEEVYVPSIPHLLPVTRVARDNEWLRSVLIVDETKRVKPRLSWYDPYDSSWAPSGWFKDGVVADMEYYFGSASEVKK